MEIRVRFLVVCIFVMCFSPLSNAENIAKALEKREWIKVSSPNFSIISDDKEEKITNLAKELEYFRSFVQMWTNTKLVDSNPIKVFAAASKKSFKIISAGKKNLKRTSGYFISNANGNYAIVRNTRRRKAKKPLPKAQGKFYFMNISIIWQPWNMP